MRNTCRHRTSTSYLIKGLRRKKHVGETPTIITAVLGNHVDQQSRARTDLEFHARLTSAGTVLLISVRPHAILQVYARPVIWQNGR